MGNLKSFENFEGGVEVMSPNEFAEKYNTDYKFIIYVNGKPTSGWESLLDAIRYGIAESHFELFSEDMMDFEDEMDMALGEFGIDVNDDIDDIDEDELNGAVQTLSDKYNYEKSIQIRLVESDDDSYYKNNNINMKYLKTFENYKPFKSEEQHHEVRCNNCEWSGIEDDLVSVNLGNEGDPEFITGCPNCETDEYLMDTRPTLADKELNKTKNVIKN